MLDSCKIGNLTMHYSVSKILIAAYILSISHFMYSQDPYWHDRKEGVFLQEYEDMNYSLT